MEKNFESLPAKVKNHYSAENVIEVAFDKMQNEWINVIYKNGHLTQKDTWKVVPHIGWAIKFTDSVFGR